MIITANSVLNVLVLAGGVWTAARANSESEKWSWPTSVKSQQVTVADNRKDIFYERFDDNPKNERIRVPTSYYDSNRRPHSQQYQQKESSTNRPKPLSDEFSNEYSGENYGGAGGNRFPQQNFPNRFGPQAQGDFPPQFGGYNPQFGGPQQFPGAGVGGVGGAGGFGYPGQYPSQGGSDYFGYPQQNHHNPANGILVGPGGPTGVFGRPRYPQHFGGGGFGYPQQFPGYPNQFGFDGQHNNIGINPYNQGGFGSPYNQQFAGGNGQFYGGGPLFDTQSKNSAVKKIEKSAE